MANGEGYWSRSWALLTRDEGWFKPLLVLAAARMVPIVGPLGADGYALEWARLTSWGVDSSPKQKGVDVGGCLKSGARAFVVALGYLFAYALVRIVVGLVLGEGLSAIAFAVLGFIVGVLIMVAKLRATIYQSIGAGYQVERIYDMVKYDFTGLLRIAGLFAVVGMVIGLISGIVTLAAITPHIGSMVREFIEYDQYGYVDDFYVVGSVLSGIAASMPALFVVHYLVNVLTSGMSLIMNTAVGLWLRQFDVRNWGTSSDPLPVSVTGATAAPTAVGYDTPSVATEAPQSYEPVAPYPQETNPEAAVSQEYAAQTGDDFAGIEPLVVETAEEATPEPDDPQE